MIKNDYKKTLNIPKTNFPMRGNLTQNEPKILAFWEEIGLYNIVSKKRNVKKIFIIQDGPPYANGNIHLGHALNKIIKDIINKHKLLLGYNIDYVPGWDCHGLPIELQVKNELKTSNKVITKENVLETCTKYVYTQIKKQMCSFKRLGILGDWENTYLTMSEDYKKTILKIFYKIIKNKQLYIDRKPLPWCISCTSTLAEVEINYKEKETDSLYVLFKVIDKYKILTIFTKEKTQLKEIYFVVWTTTPWTLPGNSAVALHPTDVYILTTDNAGYLYVIAENLKENIPKGIDLFKTILGKCSGSYLLNTTLQHPMYTDVKIKVITDIDVKNDIGTGCIHIAPAHGMYDFILGKKYKLKIKNCVNTSGFYLKDISNLGGKHINDANTITEIYTILNKNKTLFHINTIQHNFPYCWRHDTPLIHIATDQWFVNLRKHNFLNKAIQSVNNEITWYPHNGKQRMLTMLRNRPDWCISRQRLWGVGLPVLLNKEKNEFYPKKISTINNILRNLKSNKCVDIINIIKKTIPLDKKQIYKDIPDILDVWFDSGAVPIHYSKKKINLFVEGSDQYRGWFQTTLLLTLLCRKKNPCSTIITHGFVVDGNGHKMSKTLGNYITPEEIISKYGSDVLRLWVASSEYYKDIQISDVLIERVGETYKKIRNTIRYLASTLYDFNIAKNKIDTKNYVEIDKWILHKMHQYQKNIRLNYEKYKIHNVVKLIYEFCTTYLSCFYLDITKNRQYTFNKNSNARRSAQTVVYYILRSITKWVAPILSFTAEEIHNLDVYSKTNVTIFLSNWDDTTTPTPKTIGKLNINWELLQKLKHIIYKEIEKIRVEKNIKNNLEIELICYVDNTIYKRLKKYSKELKYIFVVSKCTIKQKKIKNNTTTNELENISINIIKTKRNKCLRCWQQEKTTVTVNDNTLCVACVTNLTHTTTQKRLYV